MNPKMLMMDIDGTIIQDDRPIEGAVSVFNQLIQSGIKINLLSNMTGRSSNSILEALSEMGFQVAENSVYTSVDAAKHFISKNFSKSSGKLYLPENTRKLFQGYTDCSDRPSYVLLGDLDEQYNYDLILEIIGYIEQEAQLIVFHRNKFFRRKGKFYLDSGAFTNLIEDVTGHAPHVCGKPSVAMVNQIMLSDQFNYQNNEILVVGDDVDTDIKMAYQAGLNSALIQTGKYCSEKVRNSEFKPSVTFKNLWELKSEILK